MEAECPSCMSEGAYFNGLCFECPDCEYVWGCIEDDDPEDNYDTKNFD